MFKAYWSIPSKTPLEFYQKTVAESVANLILHIDKGSPLPLSPETNPIEKAIQDRAHKDLERGLQALTAKHKPLPQLQTEDISNQCLRSVAIKTDEALAEGHRLHEHCITECRQTLTDAQHSEKSLHAYQQACGIERSPHQTSKTKVMIGSLVFGFLETAFNSLQLFGSGAVEGGGLEALSIASLVSLVNLLTGYICGEFLWRYLLRVNQSPWRVAAGCLFGLLVGLVVIINLAFAYVRTFGLNEVTLAAVNGKQYLAFFGVLLVGLGVFTLSTLKWADTNEPLIAYERLYKLYQARRQAFEECYQTSIHALEEWLNIASDTLEANLKQVQIQQAQYAAALERTRVLSEQEQRIAHQKQQFYSTVLTYARRAVVDQCLAQTPTYFFAEPHVQFKPHFSTLELEQKLQITDQRLAELSEATNRSKRFLLLQAKEFQQLLCQLKESHHARV